ncbi:MULTISPECIES: cytochrome c oxidase subunit II [Halorussus]|uniref:cytochrome c oxidase subunit II n=1 Tax=Halorussus TaxID=1070314 RepID=UPI0034A31CAA
MGSRRGSILQSAARRWRVVALGAALLLTVGVGPAAAQSVNRNLIGQLNRQLLYVALPLTLFVEVILVYAVVRFRDNDDPEPTAENPQLEITWTVATGIVLLFVGLSAYNVLASPYISPTPSPEGPADGAGSAGAGEGVRVHVLGYQWGWQFTYPNANVTTQGVLVLPRDRNATLRLRSAQVLHSFFVPKLGVKQDTFPSYNTTIRTRPLRTGEYRAYCTEFCGEGHARMRARVVVVDPATYRRWLSAHEGQREVTAAPNVTASANATEGNVTGSANATAPSNATGDGNVTGIGSATRVGDRRAPVADVAGARPTAAGDGRRVPVG